MSKSASGSSACRCNPTSRSGSRTGHRAWAKYSPRTPGEVVVRTQATAPVNRAPQVASAVQTFFQVRRPSSPVARVSSLTLCEELVQLKPRSMPRQSVGGNAATSLPRKSAQLHFVEKDVLRHRRADGPTVRRRERGLPQRRLPEEHLPRRPPARPESTPAHAQPAAVRDEARRAEVHPRLHRLRSTANPNTSPPTRAPLEPVSYYGVSKLAGDLRGRLPKLYGLNTSILRYCSTSTAPARSTNEFGGVVSSFSARS